MTAIEEIKHAKAMKVLGWTLIVLSVVEFGIGGAVYGFLTNIHLGAWWGAICCFIAGVCGAWSNTRSAVVTGLVFSIFAVIVSIVGAIVDGIAGAVIEGETACGNSNTGEMWGTEEGQYNVYICALDWYSSSAHTNAAPAISTAATAAKTSMGKTTEAFYNLYYNRPYNNNNNNFFYNHPNWVFYYNVNHFYYNWYQTHNTYYWNSNHGGNNNNNNNYYNNNYYYGYGSFKFQCICTDNSLCYGYDLASGENCGTILTTYNSLLAASTAVLSILAVVSLIYSIFTCIACGRPSSVVSTSTPVVQQVQLAPVAAPASYVQPGMAQPGMGYAPVGYAPQTMGYPVGYAPAPVGYAAAPQPMGYAPQPMGYGAAPQPVMMQPQQQPVMYAAQSAVMTAAPVGYAPVVQAADTKFV